MVLWLQRENGLPVITEIQSDLPLLTLPQRGFWEKEEEEGGGGLVGGTLVIVAFMGMQ